VQRGVAFVVGDQSVRTVGQQKPIRDAQKKVAGNV